MPIFMANEDGSFVPARTTSRASLVVLSVERTADDITAQLGILPDRWWRAGEVGSHPQDPRWRPSRPKHFNGWELGSRLAEEAPPDAHVVDLLDVIGDAAERVADIAADQRIHSVRLWLAHHSDNVNPGFSLNTDLMKRLARLGASLDIDVYALSESEGDE
jgi:uncharacterized protein DUF4279